MRIINIVDNATKVNFGIWNAAMATSEVLKKEYGVQSELWYPKIEETLFGEELQTLALPSTKEGIIPRIVSYHQLDPSDTIICTHGCWRFPTRWGAAFQKIGFKWVYVPHGMLEPWSLMQKKWQKKVYLNFVEGVLANKAAMIRAVGAPEHKNLRQHFPRHSNLSLIPNGVPTHQPDFKLKDNEVCQVLYMSRLHHKKCVRELVEAWLKSNLNNHPGFKLIIAGPDQGELEGIQQLLAKQAQNNVEYIGAVYGAEKEMWLNKSSFYALPSKSEGFPTAILEAMSYGLVPIITEGCNFPDVFTQKLGVKVRPQVEAIREGLNQLEEIDRAALMHLQDKASNYINANYSLPIIAKMQFEQFDRMLKETTVLI